MTRFREKRTTRRDFEDYEIQYKSYTLRNYKEIPQVRSYLSEEQLFDIDVVARVFPFRTNNYVVDELIRWDNVPADPIFALVFPQREMLQSRHFAEVAHAVRSRMPRAELDRIANRIRMQLNPHPAGQMVDNVPQLSGRRLKGIQHKYEQTVLFFPNQGQTCHAYCTFCFRWPQFVGMDELKFAMKEANLLVSYLREHREVTDVLFTGGDPMVMNSRVLSSYIDPLLNANVKSHQTIRIGTKSLSFWPYRFLWGPEAEETLALFKRIVQAGKHLAIMAHFSHPRELSTPAVKRAIRRIRRTGAEIRTQSPILAHINDNADVWAQMWQKQVQYGCIPYYMFIVRDTGAQHHFGIPLSRAYEIYRDAYQKVSGLARTVRGPSMSAGPGKIQVAGIQTIKGRQVFVLNMMQARKPGLVMQPFFAKFDKTAMWIDELEPAFAKKFIFD